MRFAPLGGSTMVPPSLVAALRIHSPPHYQLGYAEPCARRLGVPPDLEYQSPILFTGAACGAKERLFAQAQALDHVGITLGVFTLEII